MIDLIKELIWGSEKEEIEVEESEEEEDDEHDHRPIAEFEEVVNKNTRTSSHTVERKVEIIHFTDSNPIVVEYDEADSTGEYLVLKSVSDITAHGGALREGDVTSLQFDNEVTKVNEMSVTHREVLGTYDVEVTRQVVIDETYNKLVNEDELPDEVFNSKQVPYRRKLAVDEHDTDIYKSRYQYGFERLDGDIIHGRYYSVDEFTEPTSIKPEKNIGHVLQNSVSGNTQQLQAVSADGNMTLPESDAGEGNQDIMQVQALPETGSK